MPPTNEPNNRPENGRQFEQRIEKLLESKLPHCSLPGVLVFPADEAMLVGIMSNELDFIVHLKQDDTHTLLIVECKSGRVTGEDNTRGGFSKPTPTLPWMAHYPKGPEDIKKQLRAQRKALLTNLEPIDGVVHVHAVVVAARAEGLDSEPGFITLPEPPFFEMTLIRAERFEDYLAKLLKGATALRVQQSEILRRIRLGQPVPALGHPEIYNAIEYCRRCRTFIDSEIFHHLDFKSERWAINGSAGMGKSVLLVYATMVLITDRYIDTLGDGTRFLQSFTERAEKIGLPSLEKRRVWVVANTDKQRKILEQMFVRFNTLYGDIDRYNEFRRVKPEFHILSEIADLDSNLLHESKANVLLVDEAHDLGLEWEERLRDWHERAPGNYLVIACDRHQKLRLSKDDSRMIKGLNFSRTTTKLKRNYRNPFPAYAGSLGLLFRWFTSDGPKILPNENELLDAFGFAEIFNETADRLLLRSRNDAHPANNWSHTLSAFPSAESAFQQLSEFPLRKDQVLWVRFSAEESGFNYENLQRWSYHSVHSVDANDLLDKYIKGQEFPVVVIEGVPWMFAWSEVAHVYPHDLQKARVEMWQARRLVYLAASRTNVFLYFILPPHTPPDVAAEFNLMFTQLGRHPEQVSPAGTLWELRVSKLGEVETLDDYLDAIEAETVVETVGTEPVVVTPAGSANEAKTARVDGSLAPAISLPVTEPASVKPEETNPAKVPVTKKDPLPAPVTPVAEKPTNIASVSGNVPPVVLPPPPIAPKAAMVTISSLADEFRRPVGVVINILKKHGYKELSDNTPVQREVAARILRKTIATPLKSAGLNPLADQLDGKLQEVVAVPNAPKQNASQP